MDLDQEQKKAKYSVLIILHPTEKPVKNLRSEKKLSLKHWIRIFCPLMRILFCFNCGSES